MEQERSAANFRQHELTRRDYRFVLAWVAGLLLMTGKLGYRRYQVDYDKNNFKYDSAMHGLYVGVGFRF